MMTKPLHTYKTFDIVTVPFPFVTDARVKLRPALIISSHDFFNKFADHCILAMITSSESISWPYDTRIQDYKKCGLLKPCLIRFKLFTINNILIKDPIGRLSAADQKKVHANFTHIFAEFF